MKMDEINKIIRELWRNTYKGNGKVAIYSSMYIYIHLLSNAYKKKIIMYMMGLYG